MVRVMLGHTWRLFREALRAVLAQEADLEVVAEVADADEVLHHASRTRPDVIVLDVALPGVVPVHKLGQRLLDTLPECMVLVLLDRRTHGGAGVTLTRLAPRVGLLGTDASPADLVTAIQRMAAGHAVLDTGVAIAALTADNNPLTEREREVLRLAVAGIPTKEIATTLHLSAGTVRNCLSRVLAKTGARSRIEAMRHAEASGWI